MTDQKIVRIKPVINNLFILDDVSVEMNNPFSKISYLIQGEG